MSLNLLEHYDKPTCSIVAVCSSPIRKERKVLQGLVNKAVINTNCKKKGFSKLDGMSVFSRVDLSNQQDAHRFKMQIMFVNFKFKPLFYLVTWSVYPKGVSQRLEYRTVNPLRAVSLDFDLIKSVPFQVGVVDLKPAAFTQAVKPEFIFNHFGDTFIRLAQITLENAVHNLCKPTWISEDSYKQRVIKATEPTLQKDWLNEGCPLATPPNESCEDYHKRTSGLRV